jgi:hypothetical protein
VRAARGWVAAASAAAWLAKSRAQAIDQIVVPTAYRVEF